MPSRKSDALTPAERQRRRRARFAERGVAELSLVVSIAAAERLAGLAEREQATAGAVVERLIMRRRAPRDPPPNT